MPSPGDSTPLGITRQLAAFTVDVSFTDLSSAVIAHAKKGILDMLGVALIGSTERSTRMILNACIVSGGAGTATVLGTDKRTTPMVAALINGYAAQALDYDDTQRNSITHMSAPVLATALAAAEMSSASGKDLLTAYVAGFDVGCRLGKAARFSRHLSRHGMHATGILGHFGATAAAGKLMGLDALQIASSFGIAASQAAGLMRAFGTMCKPLHAGNAAQDAILSASLSKQGFTAPVDILDGEQSLFATFHGQTDRSELLADLGRRFEIADNTIKLFACTGWRNSIVEAMIQMARDHDVKPHDVRSVQLWVFTEMAELPNYAQPKTGLEAKFSAEFAAAVALTDRAGGIAQFADERVADARLADLCGRITLKADPSMRPHEIRVLIHTADGRELSHFVSPHDEQHATSWEQVAAKFRANASQVLPEAQVDTIPEMVENLERLPEAALLIRRCSTSPVPA